MVEMSTMFDSRGRRIRPGDRVRFTGRPPGNAGTVTGVYVKCVQVRWDRRHRNAKQQFTRVYPHLLEVITPVTADHEET